MVEKEGRGYRGGPKGKKRIEKEKGKLFIYVGRGFY